MMDDIFYFGVIVCIFVVFFSLKMPVDIKFFCTFLLVFLFDIIYHKIISNKKTIKININDYQRQSIFSNLTKNDKIKKIKNYVDAEIKNNDSCKLNFFDICSEEIMRNIRISLKMKGYDVEVVKDDKTKKYNCSAKQC